MLGRHIADAILLPYDVKNIFSAYRAGFNTYPNFIHPRNFNEYIQRCKLTCRGSFYTQCTDKLLVRDYIEKKIGGGYLTKLLWHGKDLRTVDISALPDSFIIKANQGSGANIIVRDKDSFDFDKACHTTSAWLEHDNSIHYAEWQYRWIEPQLLIEELLTNADGSIPYDYKFFCFRGRAEFLQIDFDRYSDHRRNLYDRDFNLLPVKLQYPNYFSPVEKPKCYDEMRSLSETISNGEPFVRVDLYDVNGPIFGEMTFSPGAGRERFEPEEWNVRLGKLALGHLKTLHQPL